MKVDFVDLKRQDKIYRSELLSAIEKVIENADFIMGEELERFEQDFAKYCGKKYCVGLNSGTDALLFALIAHGIKEGDEVITVANTYFSTAMVISLLGATPVFVDMDPDSYNIDVTKIKEKITERTKAIIPVHLYGQSADMAPIIKIAQKYNLKIVEDACQAHGTKYKGRQVPVTDTGAFSFYPGKNLGAFGDAGALVTDNEEIEHKVRLLRNDGSIKKYQHEIIGYKSRLDNIQAAILNVKLKYLDEFVEKRRSAAKKYSELLSGISQIKTPKEMEYGEHSYHIYAIVAEQRDELQKFLTENGIKTVVHYPTPIHLQKPYREQGFKEGDFPNAEKFSKKTLSLPMFPEITEEEIEYVADKIKQFYKQQ